MFVGFGRKRLVTVKRSGGPRTKSRGNGTLVTASHEHQGPALFCPRGQREERAATACEAGTCFSRFIDVTEQSSIVRQCPSCPKPRAFIDERKSQRICVAGAGGRPRYGRQCDPPGDCRNRAEPGDSDRREELPRRASRPGHLFHRHHSLPNGRSRGRRAGGFRTSSMVTACRGRVPLRPARTEARNVDTFLDRIKQRTGIDFELLTRPKKAGWSSSPSSRRVVIVPRGRCSSRWAAAARASRCFAWPAEPIRVTRSARSGCASG